MNVKDNIEVLAAAAAIISSIAWVAYVGIQESNQESRNSPVLF